MLDNLFGVPAHPLLAHLPLLLVPLASIAALVAVAVQRHRRRLAGIALVVTVFAGISLRLAVGSGQSLGRRVENTDLVRRHVRMGNRASFYVLFLFIVLLVLALVPESSYTPARAQRRRVAVATTSLLVVIAAVLTSVAIFRVGISGTKAVWSETPSQESPSQQSPSPQSPSQSPSQSSSQSSSQQSPAQSPSESASTAISPLPTQ